MGRVSKKVLKLLNDCSILYIEIGLRIFAGSLKKLSFIITSFSA